MDRSTFRNHFKQVISIILFVFCFISFFLSDLRAENDVFTARPNENGFLHVEGTKIIDEKGDTVILRGISAHGLTWYPEYINVELFSQLSQEWNCNLIRLPMYSKIYVEEDRKTSLEVLEKGIEAAIASDMYVLVDWHILEDNDPNLYLEEAEQFFNYISDKYSDVPNVLYEICNEPNGDTDWNAIKRYANRIIETIRHNSSKSLIIVGTPAYDQDLESVAKDPLDHDNIMYTLHFYAATHYDDLRNELMEALDRNIPVFITECGISEADGNGRLDYENAGIWFDLLDEQQISYAVWSLSNKAESSALIRPDSFHTKYLDDQDLSAAGKYVKELVKGTKASTIVPPEENDDRYNRFSAILSSLGGRGLKTISCYPVFTMISLFMATAFFAGGTLLLNSTRKGYRTYDSIVREKTDKKDKKRVLKLTVIFLSIVVTIDYFIWRIRFSLPQNHVLGIIANLILLFFELTGFLETLVHYAGMLNRNKHELPKISDEEYPDVDIFIATYNEDEELLRRTINGCKHLKYPDLSKVHIWLCDDNRRPSMRKLAKKMNIGYFDRENNEGAKAGNLNKALERTGSPYIVTLDADMIVRSDFLLKTIPYFVNFEKYNVGKPESENVHLGLLQTPQCFYEPDVFQYALYSEYNAPNEQDFFYRSIEEAKTSTNSVIYGGSNTVLSRKALEDIGGFYTQSITEDFATGMLIEAAGYVSLALKEPLASGKTPQTFQEHVQQRTRWGRGVIVTARKLKLFSQKGLSMAQKISYWSSVFYWYSPIKNFIYIIDPLLFAVLNLPVFECNWLELAVYWLPMFLIQDIALRLISGNEISSKWSGIYETSVMPSLLIPILKESIGISLSKFKVTDKSSKQNIRKIDYRLMMPFLILLGSSVLGLIRVTYLLFCKKMYGLITIVFWLIRNSYFLLMSVFLIDGRDANGDTVRVKDGEPVIVTRKKGKSSVTYEGITTLISEHHMEVFLDECRELKIGDNVSVCIDTFSYNATLKGVVTDVRRSRYGSSDVYRIEILDFGADEEEYFQILYDRIPTLPQSLKRDFGVFFHLWKNIAIRLGQSVK
ncbi:MAG: cellulase family glycosylhydrolase [Erysipelotrichaceae bacterium]|nr:cellulase family glycosylhydrolase [Erysipelotrichaceae bacterium]